MKTISIATALCSLTLGAMLGLAGCGAETSNRTAADPSTAGVGDTAHAVPAPSAAASEVKSYSFHGTPVAIDTVAGTITIRHEAIEGFAPAGSDTYPVASPAILGGAVVGKETHLTLRVAGGSALVTKIQEGHESAADHEAHGGSH